MSWAWRIFALASSTSAVSSASFKSLSRAASFTLLQFWVPAELNLPNWSTRGSGLSTALVQATQLGYAPLRRLGMISSLYVVLEDLNWDTPRASLSIFGTNAYISGQRPANDASTLISPSPSAGPP